jgi:hypothetical protein
MTVGVLLMVAAVAEPSAKSPESDLSELMIATQFRHIKLWFAGKLGNWRLAAYELDQIKSALEEAARRFPAKLDTEAAVTSISLLRNAIKAKDIADFFKAYTELTHDCNSCHRAVGRDFITVQVPPISPFTDQIFSDQAAEGRALARSARLAMALRILGAARPVPPRRTLPNWHNDRRSRTTACGNCWHRTTGGWGLTRPLPNPRLSENPIEAIVAYFDGLRAE